MAFRALPKKLEVELDLGVSIPGLHLPGVKLKGEWEPKGDEPKAAWELYVELATRVTTIELKGDEGLLRDALASLYSLATTTRDLLKKYGPGIAEPRPNDSELSFAEISVRVLNQVIRPILSYWHPALEAWETGRKEGESRLEHEKAWKENAKLRGTLNEIRPVLIRYAQLLQDAAHCADLIGV